MTDVAEVNPPFSGAVGVSNDFPRRFNGLSKAPLPERSSRYELEKRNLHFSPDIAATAAKPGNLIYIFE